MSTPRQLGACIRHGYGNSIHEKQDDCVNWFPVAEGVAAPLEPLAINFANQLMGVLNDLYGHTFDILGEQAIVHALDSFAAAVSKNAEFWRDAAHRKHERSEARILELEKEITALREKPL